MNAELRHLSSVRGDSACVIQRAEMREQIAGTRKHCRRWRVEPAQITGVTHAPVRQIQSERSEIRLSDLRLRERRQTSLRSFTPGAIADARFNSTCPSLPLIGRRSRDTLRLQPAHPRCGIEQRAPHEPGVNNDAYPRNRETRLR